MLASTLGVAVTAPDMSVANSLDAFAGGFDAAGQFYENNGNGTFTVTSPDGSASAVYSYATGTVVGSGGASSAAPATQTQGILNSLKSVLNPGSAATPVASASTIAGIPTTYLLVGAALFGFLALKKRT